MSWLFAALLGIVEGLTEFLPVSSTGHLILFSALFGRTDEASKTLDIAIQLGAILAVVVLYRSRFLDLGRGLLRRDPLQIRLASALFVAFVPAALVGYLFHKTIKERLFGPRPVIAALFVGGLLMIGVEKWRAGRKSAEQSGLEHITLRRALIIGLCQCLSLWPGASRSMTTIVGGQISGLNTQTSAEFSFLLGVPVLGAATAFDLYKNSDVFFSAPDALVSLGTGLAFSFVTAMLVIVAFIHYLRRFGLLPFGIYRIALSAAVLLLSGNAADSS